MAHTECHLTLLPGSRVPHKASFSAPLSRPKRKSEAKSGETQEDLWPKGVPFLQGFRTAAGGEPKRRRRSWPPRFPRRPGRRPPPTPDFNPARGTQLPSPSLPFARSCAGDLNFGAYPVGLCAPWPPPCFQRRPSLPPAPRLPSLRHALVCPAADSSFSSTANPRRSLQIQA